MYGCANPLPCPNTNPGVLICRSCVSTICSEATSFAEKASIDMGTFCKGSGLRSAVTTTSSRLLLVAGGDWANTVLDKIATQATTFVQQLNAFIERLSPHS